MSVIYEHDMFDQDVHDYGLTVRCEDCDDLADAVDMRRQSDGGWLCVQCESGYEAEWQDNLRRMKGW